VTSIRTLERQIRRLKASPYAELRSLGEEATAACAAPPACAWDRTSPEPVAPTLAKYCDPDEHLRQAHDDLRRWAADNLPPASGQTCDMDLVRPSDVTADIVATLLYRVTDRPFRELYDLARDWSAARRAEAIDVALRSRTRHDDLLREFRGGLYVFDIVMDIGAYRDLHRHRRCQQFRQEYRGNLGYATPEAIGPAGLDREYRSALDAAFATMRKLPEPGSHYLLPFAGRGRFLFKMDFAEAEYISRLRSGVKGHFSYREVAWRMKTKLAELEPELARLIDATPPWEEDPLTR
jgi:hypothetical protein